MLVSLFIILLVWLAVCSPEIFRAYQGLVFAPWYDTVDTELEIRDRWLWPAKIWRELVPAPTPAGAQSPAVDRPKNPGREILALAILDLDEEIREHKALAIRSLELRPWQGFVAPAMANSWPRLADSPKQRAAHRAYAAQGLSAWR